MAQENASVPCPTPQELAIIQALQAEQQQLTMQSQGACDAYMAMFSDVSDNFLELRKMKDQNRHLKVLLGLNDVGEEWLPTPCCEMVPLETQVPMPRFMNMMTMGRQRTAERSDPGKDQKAALIFTQSTMASLHNEGYDSESEESSVGSNIDCKELAAVITEIRQIISS